MKKCKEVLEFIWKEYKRRAKDKDKQEGRRKR